MFRTMSEERATSPTSGKSLLVLTDYLPIWSDTLFDPKKNFPNVFQRYIYFLIFLYKNLLKFCVLLSPHPCPPQCNIFYFIP